MNPRSVVGRAKVSPGKAFLLSAALPGAGQYAQGHRRWLGYAAAELSGWVFWARARSRANGFQADFEDLAWTSARTFTGPRIDGDWEYYERLTKFERSGAFDTDPTLAGLQPEVDETTFNGDSWRLARQLNFRPGTNPQPGDPDYEAALGFYRDRAASTKFEWDWGGLDTERLDYEDLIEESDSAFHDASLLGGAIVFNHVLGALDAFISSRISSMADLPIRVTSSWAPGMRHDTSVFALSAEWRVR